MRRCITRTKNLSVLSSFLNCQNLVLGCRDYQKKRVPQSWTSYREDPVTERVQTTVELWYGEHASPNICVEEGYPLKCREFPPQISWL